MSPSDDKKKQERLDQTIREGINSGFTEFNSIEELMDDLNSDDDPDSDKLTQLRKEVDRGFAAPMRAYTHDELRDLFNRIDALLDGFDYEDLDLNQMLPEDEEDDL